MPKPHFSKGKMLLLRRSRKFLRRRRDTANTPTLGMELGHAHWQCAGNGADCAATARAVACMMHSLGDVAGFNARYWRTVTLGRGGRQRALCAYYRYIEMNPVHARIVATRGLRNPLSESFGRRE